MGEETEPGLRVLVPGGIFEFWAESLPVERGHNIV